VSKVVQSGLVSEPWKELLELTAGLPQKTQEEVIAGKMALLRHRLEEKHGDGWEKMLNWGSFKIQLEGFNGDADAGALFRLQEFTALNETLQKHLELWNITTLNAAAIAEHGMVRVKAVIGPDNSVEFDEPKADFPSDQLMTQLRMIAPDKRGKRG
jgi:hypothetical protein